MKHSECPPPTKGLIQNIRSRDWDGAKSRILSYPWDAHYRTISGNNSTPLHLVCLYRAPIDVVELLLDANPSALVAQDTEGWTPIHLVLLYGGDENVAMLLIRRGGVPAASIQSRFIGSPLHLACRHGCSRSILKQLISANPLMASTANETGTKPAAFVWHQFVRTPKNEHVVRELRNTGGWVQGVGKDDSGILDLLERVTILLQAAKQEDPDAPSILVHDLVSFQSELGSLSQFLSLAIQLFPEQVAHPDVLGNLALHMTAASSPSRVQLPPSLRVMDHTKDPIDILARAFPSTAGTPNRNGEIPLHLALTKGRRTWRTGISTLVDVEPDSLLLRHQHLELYPFQLAAAFPAEDELESLETILELLLGCPHALQC
jgi:ankyrin repeat protein